MKSAVRTDDAPAPPPVVIAPPPGPDRRRVHRLSFVVGGVGLVVTAGLAVAAWTVYRDNEQDILSQRAREVAALITISGTTVRSPLVSAAELAEASGGDTASFSRATAPLTTGPLQSFASISLWPLDVPDPQPLATVGVPSRLASEPPERIAAFLALAKESSGFVVADLLESPERRIGFGKTSSELGKRFMVYGETAVPPNPRPPARNDEAYAGLGYALYLGDAERTDKALLTSTLDLPLRGTRATAEVAYGDTELLLVVTDEAQLGGPLLAALPWLIAVAGLAVTIAAVILTERLQRRRDHAETLVAALADIAGENARLYAEQRTVAQRLQQSLLPKVLPAVPGIELAARYEPGVDALDIGGDWYDVMTLSDDRLLFVVGDVSGRGLDAAALMASLRYATRAYAAQGDDPATIATKLGKLIDVARDGHFATMLCGVLDVAHREVTLVNAGHPDPLIVESGRARFAEVPVGAPVGVGGGPAYRTARLAVPPGADLLAFTDGLYERRDEPVDVSLERLREVAAGRHESLDALLGKVLDDLAPRRGADDTALLGVRWES